MKHNREQRRAAARSRFVIIPNAEKQLEKDDYEKYLERKVTEAKALGLVPKDSTLRFAINMLG